MKSFNEPTFAEELESIVVWLGVLVVVPATTVWFVGTVVIVVAVV